jgi:hypothetical protein
VTKHKKENANRTETNYLVFFFTLRTRKTNITFLTCCAFVERVPAVRSILGAETLLPRGEPALRAGRLPGPGRQLGGPGRQLAARLLSGPPGRLAGGPAGRAVARPGRQAGGRGTGGGERRHL